GSFCLGPPFLVSRQHAPLHMQRHTALDKAQKRTAATDLDIVGMRAQTKQPQRTSGIGKRRQINHSAIAILAARRSALCLFQGISPFSTMSSSVCQSRSVSMDRQKPPY